MDTRKIMLISTDGHSNVYANIGLIKVPINFTTPAIHIANLAYRNNIAYDDIVWSDTISPGQQKVLRNAVYDLMAPDDVDRNMNMYRVDLTHKIDPARDIVAYVKGFGRPTAIGTVGRMISHNHSIDMYDADATLV